MSTKYIIQLLKSDRRPSPALLQKLSNVIPQTLQKRMVMYANGDKRISKTKLIRDLAQQTKGGTPNVSPIFLFGLPSPGEQSPQSPSPINVYKFAPPNPGSPMANMARLGALSFKYRNMAAESEKTFQDHLQMFIK